MPFGVVETGGTRPDVARHFERDALRRSGFSGRVETGNLAGGDITLKAWAIDLQKERAFPIANGVRLQLPP
jgi:hypothetical protein